MKNYHFESANVIQSQGKTGKNDFAHAHRKIIASFWNM